MNRYLEAFIKKDLQEKIVLLSGPRQVGKTTLSRQLGLRYDYLNYDAAPDRKTMSAREWDRKAEVIIFDEIHKMKKWKAWIKGVYDTEGIHPALLVTGSARLDVFRKGGDSLSGRYFAHRLCPFTVKEASAFMDSSEALTRIIALGGFPEPFLKNDPEFARRWRRSHLDTVLREDLLDLERVRDIKSLEILVDILRQRVGSPVSFSSLAGDLQVSPHTVKHWLQILENLYMIFPVRPYHRNIARSILQESKYFFYDTGAVEGDDGARLENAVAVSLLAELNYHEDITGERTALCTLRDKEKREVDFLTLVAGQPRHLIEVKLKEAAFSKHLYHFKRFLPNVEAVQLVKTAERHKTTSDGLHLYPAHRFLKDFTLLPMNKKGRS